MAVSVSLRSVVFWSASILLLSCKSPSGQTSLSAISEIGNCTVEKSSKELDVMGKVVVKLSLKCSDNQSYETSVKMPKREYDVGDRLTCVLTPNAQGKIWSCDNEAVSFTSSGTPGGGTPSPGPSGVGNPSGMGGMSPGGNPPGMGGMPPGGNPPGMGGMSSGENPSGGGAGNGAKSCTPEYNLHNVTCAKAQLTEDQEACRWNERWKCKKNGCALWIGHCGETDKCKKFNNDGLTCGAIDLLKDGEEGCKWGQKWRCNSGCAQYIDASCGGRGGGSGGQGSGWGWWWQ